MTTPANVCQECGNALTATRQPERMFCSPVCRQTFNNRRMQRGAEIYDLFRALRRERSEAKRLNLWTKICQLELSWNIEDEKQRPGRKSYVEPKKALANLVDKGSIPRGEVIASTLRAGR